MARKVKTKKKRKSIMNDEFMKLENYTDEELLEYARAEKIKRLKENN